jgi:hypothetical protein
MDRRDVNLIQPKGRGRWHVVAVVLLTIANQECARAVRITDEPAYRDHFMPFCATLGLQLMSAGLRGVHVAPNNIPLLREEFLRLKRHVLKTWFFKPKRMKLHIPHACDVGVSELDRFASEGVGQLYFLSSYRPQEATGLEPFDHEALWPLGRPYEFRPYIEPLFSLTSMTDWSELAARCRSFGWKADADFPDDDVWLLGDRLRFCVGHSDANEERPFGFVFVYFFEDVREPGMAEFYPPGRSDYDRAYATALSQIREVIGDPAAQGEYRYHFRSDRPYHYAIWPGEAGVLILRQDEIDIQFGMDVNLWVQPWSPEEPLPVPPIDWS